MLLITFTSKEVMNTAIDFSTKNKLPLWIIGLFAPLLFVFQKIKKWFGGLFQGGTQEEIREENESIKEDLKKLRLDVNNLNEWRRDAIQNEINRINVLKQNLEPLENRNTRLSEQIKSLSGKPASELISELTDEEIQKEIEKRNARIGIRKGELQRID